MPGTLFILPDIVEEVDPRSTTRVLKHKFNKKSNRSTQQISKRVLTLNLKKGKRVLIQNRANKPTVQTSKFTTKTAKRTEVDRGKSGMKKIKNKRNVGRNVLLKSTVATEKKLVATLINGDHCVCTGDILRTPCDSNTNCNHKHSNLALEVDLKQQDAIETKSCRKNISNCQKTKAKVNVSKKIGSNQFSHNTKVGSKSCSDQIRKRKGKQSLKKSACFHEHRLPSLSEYVALDCEFVGVGCRKTNALDDELHEDPLFDDLLPALPNENVTEQNVKFQCSCKHHSGRCSIVNYYGEVQYDIYVRPDREITDYRTPWSGIRKSDMQCAIPFEAAQSQIRNFIKGKIVIGHAVYNDFKVLNFFHPRHLIRDTAQYKPLRTLSHFPGHSVSLKYLSAHILGRRIQKREHCSVQDATACMDLFKLVRTDWERELAKKGSPKSQKKKQSDDGLYKNKEVSLLDDQYWPDSLYEIDH